MPNLMQLNVLGTQLSVIAMQLNVKVNCYVIDQTPKTAIVCDLKIVLASPKIALCEKGTLSNDPKLVILCNYIGTITHMFR